MAVEKMSLISVSGPLKKVNKTLVRCCETKCFHIEPSFYTMTYGSAHFKTLKDKDIYGGLMKRAEILSSGLGIKEKSVPYDDIQIEAIHDFDMYFTELEQQVMPLIEKKNELERSIEEYRQVLRQVGNLSNINVDFKDLFGCKHVKIRFGRLPSESYTKLEFYSEKGFVFEPLEEKDGYVWGLYFAPVEESVQIDDIFKSLYFERIRLPDFLHGDGETAAAELNRQLKDFDVKLKEVNEKLATVKQSEEKQFEKVRSKLIFLNNSYELRSQVSVINNKFYMAGFVPTREVEKFRKHLSTVSDIVIEEKKYFVDDRMKPPTKLRNNWLFRPFEMFVNMYGLPSYTGIDPTPYVAITYMLIFGIMFGDLGQGLVISLFGFILTKWKHAKLGPIMERIGISSAIFGCLYGSVFGNEDIIKPFFHIEPLYSVLGKPNSIFQISTYLLIAALAIGVILIVISMTMNIVLSFRRRDYASALFGANGITGMIFYIAVVAVAAVQLGFGIEMFTLPYVLLLVILPLGIMMFKEPLAHLVANSIKHNVVNLKHKTVADAAIMASDTLSEAMLRKTREDLEKLDDLKFVRAVYGKMPRESYEKLGYFTDKEFVFIPLTENEDNVYGVYFVSKQHRTMVDDIFAGLYFERMKMPAELTSPRKSAPEGTDKQKEKKSVGNFIIEGVIELFETCLSYLTNTMSFLRVGGFILSHAGMMLVVGVLAGDGGVGTVIVQILGNAFVIGMEGFLVGIQVLRLEFYEIFGRFYVSDGKSFEPLKANLN